MKKIIKSLYFAPVIFGCIVIAVLIWVIRDSRCVDCDERNIGIITDIVPHPSSFNSKTEIKTVNRFYVVMGFPQLQIGDSLMVRMDNKTVALLKDDTGEWFEIIHKTK